MPPTPGVAVVEVVAISGGSHNYLYCADDGDIGQRLGDVSRMAEDLDEICPEAAAATREILDYVRGVQPKIEALKDLWFAVEWWQSADYGRERAEEAVVKYRAARAAAEPGLSPAMQQALDMTLKRCLVWHNVEIGRRWTGQRLYDLLPCVLDKHGDDVSHRDPAGNTW